MLTKMQDLYAMPLNMQERAPMLKKCDSTFNSNKHLRWTCNADKHVGLLAMLTKKWEKPAMHVDLPDLPVYWVPSNCGISSSIHETIVDPLKTEKVFFYTKYKNWSIYFFTAPSHEGMFH